MALTRHDRERLRNSGFLESEVKALERSVDPAGKEQKVDLSKEGWRMAIESRIRWVSRRRTKGWTNREIRGAIEYYYKLDKKRSPWDFIQEEYRLGMTGKRISDYQDTRARRKAKQIRKTLKGYKAQ